jgi:hypothetical protein
VRWLKSLQDNPTDSSATPLDTQLQRHCVYTLAFPNVFASRVYRSCVKAESCAGILLMHNTITENVAGLRHHKAAKLIDISMKIGPRPSNDDPGFYWVISARSRLADLMHDPLHS